MSKELDKMKKITSNLKRQGKSDAQIKRMLGAYLTENKKKVNSTGEKDII